MFEEKCSAPRSLIDSQYMHFCGQLDSLTISGEWCSYTKQYTNHGVHYLQTNVSILCGHSQTRAHKQTRRQTPGNKMRTKNSPVSRNNHTLHNKTYTLSRHSLIRLAPQRAIDNEKNRDTRLRSSPTCCTIPATHRNRELDIGRHPHRSFWLGWQFCSALTNEFSERQSNFKCRIDPIDYYRHNWLRGPIESDCSESVDFGVNQLRVETVGFVCSALKLTTQKSETRAKLEVDNPRRLPWVFIAFVNSAPVCELILFVPS